MLETKSKKELSLDAPVQYAKGVGPKRAELLEKIGIKIIEDLVYYLPRKYLDRSKITQISKLIVNDDATIVGKIQTFGIKQGRMKRFVAIVSDGSGYLQCIWFNQWQRFLKVFQVGETVAFSGKVKYYEGYEMIHPDFDKLSDESDEDNFLHTGIIIPLYPSSEALSKSGLDSRGFRRIFKAVVRDDNSFISESLPDYIVKKNNLLSLNEAIRAVHFPKDYNELDLAYNRLKFEEFFYLELLLAYRKRELIIENKGIKFEKWGELTKKLSEKLPFKLTDAQKRVANEIWHDMKSSKPMNRLIQGDVGSGKTIVALISMLIAVENGYQSAMMAPTEILAEQHYLTVKRLLEELGVHVVLLVGGQRKSVREKVYEEIENGKAQIILGTHALIEEDVKFHKLGLVVIDEQHRFGVMQRARLREKGLHPDVLVMTATPIPRTLALTVYGDLDVSIIDELPKGRKPIKTILYKETDRQKVYKFLREEIQKGRQAYIVYPLVEESEKIDLKAAVESYEVLRKEIFPDLKLSLIHGRMKNDEKDSVMQSFKNGEIDILVSTTVIEVGVDVPNATVMLIEHAERFGLTQLHQLRGRVGRGEHQSYCLLIAQYGKDDDARKRLKTLEGSTDGFNIAEVDLELRGPGEFFGTRQHGLPDLKIANVVIDGQILSKAREEAFAVIKNDPELRHQAHIMVRNKFFSKYKDRLGLVKIG
jgi:ATP-dependent DNA helicase RecG